jgi:hypothetical protein
MRKSILFIMMVAVAFFAVACGGNNSASSNTAATGGDTGGTTSDAFALYKKDGRSWTYGMAGDMKSKNTVKNVKDNQADLETVTLGADGKPMGDPVITTIKFETPKVEATTAAAPAPKEPEKKNVEVKAGKFDCISTDGGKTWMMEKYPGIIVKSEHMELVEFNE